MARKAIIAREEKRRKLVEKYAEKRKALKEAGDWDALDKLPKNSCKIRLHNRCKLTGRPKGYMRKFGIKYSILHPQHESVRKDFVRVRDAAQWTAVLDRWYSDDLPGVHPDGRTHKAQGSCEN